MRYILFLVCFLFFSNLSFAGKLSICDKNFVDTIPIEFKAGKILVPVSIQGKEYRFILDTGADMEYIYKSSSINLIKSEKVFAVKDFNNKRETADVTLPVDFTIGHIHVHNSVFSVVNGFFGDCISEGVLGFNLINSGVVAKIDLTKKLLILTDRKHFFDHEEGVDIKYNLLESVPWVKFNISYGGLGYALFDTGNPEFFNMDKFIYDKFNKKKNNGLFYQQVVWKDSAQIDYGVNGLEKEAEHVFLKAKNLSMGDVNFYNSKIEGGSGSTVFGVEVLKYGSIIINPFKRAFIYQPNCGKTDITVNNYQSKIRLAYINDKPVIQLIDKNSYPYQQGARKGNVILEMDGQEITDICQFIKAKENLKEKNSYVIKLQDNNGNVKFVKINK